MTVDQIKDDLLALVNAKDRLSHPVLSTPIELELIRLFAVGEDPRHDRRVKKQDRKLLYLLLASITEAEQKKLHASIVRGEPSALIAFDELKLPAVAKKFSELCSTNLIAAGVMVRIAIFRAHLRIIWAHAQAGRSNSKQLPKLARARHALKEMKSDPIIKGALRGTDLNNRDVSLMLAWLGKNLKGLRICKNAECKGTESYFIASKSFNKYCSLACAETAERIRMRAIARSRSPQARGETKYGPQSAEGRMKISLVQKKRHAKYRAKKEAAERTARKKSAKVKYKSGS